MTPWALERAASYGGRTLRVTPLTIGLLLPFVPPAGDPLTDGVPPPSNAIGIYQFRTVLRARRVRPRVDAARLTRQFAAILARDIPGAVLGGITAAVGGEERVEGDLTWWVTIDGRAEFPREWSIDRFNYALSEAVADSTTWSPDTRVPSDPVWDFAVRSSAAHPGGAPTSRVAGNVLLNVFREPRACLGGAVDVAGSPWTMACTRAVRVGNVTAPAPPTVPEVTAPRPETPAMGAGAVRWIAGAAIAALATGGVVYAVTR